MEKEVAGEDGRQQYGLPRPKSPVISVEVPALLYFLAYGIFAPAQQAFIYKQICSFKYSKTNPTICQYIDKTTQFSSQEEAVQADYAVFSTYASVCVFTTAMVATLIMGAWCDRFSHRLPLALPHIGNIAISAMYLAYNFVPVLNENINPIYLAAVSLFPGACGFVLTEIMSASSYVSLSSDSKTRTTRLAIVQATVILGQTIGYFANAFLFASAPKNDESSFVLAFVIQIAINTYAIVSVFVFVPELRNLTRIRHQKGSSSWCRYLCAPHLIITSSFKVVFLKHELRTFRLVMLISYGMCAAFLGPFALQAVIYDFLTLQPISLSQFQYSLFMGVYAGYVDVGLLIALPLMRMTWCCNFFPFSDAALAISGAFSRIVGLLVIAFGEFYPQVAPWIFAAINLCAALTFVSLRAGMSKIFKPSQQGRLFAVIGLAEYTCILLASLAFNAIYATLVSTPAGKSIEIIHGYTFLFVAGLTLVPTILIIWLGTRPIFNWSFHRFTQNLIEPLS